jgi:hypothetical protein
MALDHLRLSCPIRIDAVERVEDEIAMISRRSEAGDYRVEDAEIYRGNKDQLAGSLRSPERRKAGGSSLKEISSVHDGRLSV